MTLHYHRDSAGFLSDSPESDSQPLTMIGQTSLDGSEAAKAMEGVALKVVAEENADPGIVIVGEMKSPSINEHHDHSDEPLDTFGDPKQISQQKISVKDEIFPTCIVWTALCGITWFCPVIGHMGICDEKGNIYEFLGMGATCGQGLAFGPVIR